MALLDEGGGKGRVTTISLAAALALTALKLVVGIATGSLGMLSEAAHSGFDTVASLITFAAVRIADRPADADHPYGHGRVENLAAVLQGSLLIGTALAIIASALRRILIAPVAVETTPWAFLVMGTSIAVDLWRSTMLARAARRYHSRALEADALNFRADLLSSTVVIVGLALTTYGETVGMGRGWLANADAIAALFVAGMILWMSGGIAWRAVAVMLDRAPLDLADRMTHAAAAVPGVVRSHPVRLRESGNRLFADVNVTVARTTSLEQAHRVTDGVEAAIRGVEPRTEVLVHPEPAVAADETASEAIRAVALRHGAQTHHEQVYVVGDRLEASLHLEVPPEATLGEAHALAHALSQALEADDPRLARVDVHIEVAVPQAERREEVTREHAALAGEIARAAAGAGLATRCHEVRLYRSAPASGTTAGGISAVLHCDFPADQAMGAVHRVTEHIEQVLLQRFPELHVVVIHAEPAEAPA